jgi:PAS domain S-box-containing protein
LSKDRGRGALEREVLEREALGGLRPAAWVLAGLYAVFSLTHAVFLEGAVRRAMVPLTAAEAALVLSFLASWKVRPPEPRAAHAWTLALGGVALLNSGALLLLTGDPKQATNLFFLVIGGGFLLLRRPHFAAYAAASGAVFALAAAAGPPSPDWTHYGFGMLSAAALAAVLHVVRRASALRLDRALREAREGEARLRTVLTGSPLALVAADRDGVVTLAGGRALGLAGLRPEDLVGREVRELYRGHPGLPMLETALAGEPVAATVEEAGHVFDVQLTPQPGGGMVGVATDVTHRRTAEEARRQAQRDADEAARLRELDRLRTAFVNVAAHELNTPLTPIRMQLSLVDTPDPERRSRAVRILRRNVDRLSRVVQDLVTVNRLQQGRLEVRPAAIDLAAVARGSADSFQDAAASRGVALRVDAPPAPAWGDAEKLQQVVDNLLANALKFTPAGGTVEVQVQAAAGDRGVRVAVRDSGAGIAAEDLPRLFRPFSQLEAGRERGGTGLGLHLSAAIVEAHGGRIWAESAGPGRGSAFTFELPGRPQAAGAAPAPAAPPGPGPG